MRTRAKCLARPPLFFGVFAAIGVRDLFQLRHSILRNYPIAAHLRFLFENIRPEMRQYFFESEKDGAPFPRDKRAIVYQRAKRVLDKRPFGTEYNVYETRYSIVPKAPSPKNFRIMIGGSDCAQPYHSSIFNISAMSYGALSANAIRSLNRGAKIGGFAHDTGEGGFSPYHEESAGDIIWEIGSGYFGCRNKNGTFSPECFPAIASKPQIKMIEIAITAEIARIRGVDAGQDCVSPARHSAFSTPIEMMDFIAALRDLSGGKPIGFKLCIGHAWEFMAIVKAMLRTGITPDFILVDGAEGGTGAAPLEFMDHVGMPLRDGLTFVHSSLIGVNLRDKIKLGASGKIASAFDIARVMALGADWCNAARGFMFALGCIQSQSCHTDRCPTGVATQDPIRQRALVVSDKSERVANFHRETVNALAELIGAAGLEHPNQLRPFHLMHRAAPDRVVTFAEIYPSLKPGELFAGTGLRQYSEPWQMARAESFAPCPEGVHSPAPLPPQELSRKMSTNMASV